MLVKESIRVLSSRSDLAAHGIFWPAALLSPVSPPSLISSHNHRPQAHRTALSVQHVELTRTLEGNRSFTRRYASTSGPSRSHPSGAPQGYTWPSSVNPTPYEILAHSKDARYNKALFYQLVKIYHPDRNHTAAGSSMPHSVRLERYRLVVAANEILSDDVKRRAYDLYGAGWHGNRTPQRLEREAD